MKRALAALALGLATIVGAAGTADALVVRTEHRDHKHKPARVQYVEQVRSHQYIELHNGATFHVYRCKRPIERGMHIKRVRRLCPN